MEFPYNVLYRELTSSSADYYSFNFRGRTQAKITPPEPITAWGCSHVVWLAPRGNVRLVNRLGNAGLALTDIIFHFP